MYPQTRVVFIRVKSSNEKLKWLVRKARFHFLHREKIAFFTLNSQTSDFVDRLLWSFESTEFIPHEVIHETTEELVMITHQLKAIQDCKVLFNLTDSPVKLPHLKLIYEFDDLSNSEKQLKSKMHFQIYKDASYAIILN